MARVFPGSCCAELLEERLALATFAVTNTNDTGAGSFRQAIRDANAGGARADTIVFDPGYFSSPREILVHNYPEQFGGVSGPLTIIGPGSHLLTIRPGVIQNPVSRKALDSFAPVLTMSGMTVTGGDATGNGGGLSCTANSNVTLDDMVFVNNVAAEGGAIALANNATLTIRNSRLIGNSARHGGGIFFFDGGSLVMENCTVTGNTATRANQYDASGGGIYFFGAVRPDPLPAGFIDRTLLVRDSTFSANSAFGGGGAIAVDWLAGTLLVRNSTLSGNTAGSSGGGIYNVVINQTSAVTLENATVTGNSANQTAPQPNAKGGGGIARVGTFPGAINVTNSLVSGNTNAVSPDILTHPQSPVTAWYSAIGSAAGFTLSPQSGNNRPFGANPLLGPLADNGGRTLTHALLPGSPLIDTGSNALIPAGVTADQRGAGFPRVVGAAVDIGAYEARDAGVTRVTHVFVNGPGLDANPAFRTAAGYSAPFGYPVPTGPAQLRPVPWVGGIDRVSVRFDRDVAGQIGQADLVVRGSSAARTFGAFGYDPGTRTATWTLAGAPVTQDKLRLVIDDAGIPNFDGDWANAERAYPSGNGAPGGDFNFRLNVLAGDATGDGIVSALDVADLKRRLSKRAGDGSTGTNGYSIFTDVNGDGIISALDLAAVKQRLTRRIDNLPEPAAAMA